MSDHRGYAENEHGTRVSVHKCGKCDDEFTVCPAVADDFGGCQAETCESYDPDRDVDDLFGADEPTDPNAPRIGRRTIQ